MKYVVHVRECWVQSYEVEAGSEKEARKIVANQDDRFYQASDLEYSHTLDDNDEYEVEEL